MVPCQEGREKRAVVSASVLETFFLHPNKGETCQSRDRPAGGGVRGAN